MGVYSDNSLDHGKTLATLLPPSTLQICESRPLGVNVNNVICIRPDPLRSKLSTFVPLDFCLLNSRCICNKSQLINDFIPDHNIDFFALSETWPRGDDSDLYYIRDICPDGYVFHHVPRLHTTGGVVGIVLKNNIKAKIQAHESNLNILSWNSGLRSVLSV